MSPGVQTQTNAGQKPSVTPVSSGVLQRQCACGTHTIAGDECSECRKESQTLQRQAISQAGPPAIPPIVREVLHSSGQPLDSATRAFMEPRFGHDFSHVRVHTDAKAAESAKSVNALAYTVGQDLVFSAGRYAPATQGGLRLLAHELTHAVQQKGTTLHPSLEIGRVDDPGEREADRVADEIAGGGRVTQLMPAFGPALLRRTPDEPKPLRTDHGHLPMPGGGEGKIHVIRKMMPCECRRVPDVREGFFYNPDIDAIVGAYRHCRGTRTTDVYAEVESNLSSFLSGGPPPTGTARIGFEINVNGRNVGGRGVIEVLGSNVSGGQGVGGRAQVVLQGGKWRVFVTSNFLHGLGANPGDLLNLNLGARVGSITAEVQVADLLSATPSGTGAGCIDIFGGSRLCATVSAGGGGGVTTGLEVRGDLPDLGGVRREDCFQCLCPPPTKRFTCYVDVPPTERPVNREIEVDVPHEHRFYFRLDKTTPSEDSALRAQGAAGLDAVASEVNAGGSVVAITGYASPEAEEATHNKPLSADRAKTMVEMLRPRLPSGTALPQPSAGGELLGQRPKAAVSSRLGEAVRIGGFRAAEDISAFLLGEEIPRAELSEQFVSLFRAMPEPEDRLALFGLEPGNPLAPQVLSAVEEFLRKPRAGARPWERVFRLLRVGVVRTSTTEKRTVPDTERTPGSLTELGGVACESKGKEAEIAGELPPVPRDLQLPHRGREDRQVECLIDVTAQDRRSGCSYEFPPSMRLRATPPARAPRRFP